MNCNHDQLVNQKPVKTKLFFHLGHSVEKLSELVSVISTCLFFMFNTDNIALTTSSKSFLAVLKALALCKPSLYILLAKLCSGFEWGKGT